MKKITLLLALLYGIFIPMYSQTNFGVSSGTLGTSFSYFGNFAGNASTASSDNNSFFGTSSGRVTTGDANTAVGAFSLFSNVNGINNTATGAFSLRNNVSGGLNTAIGSDALYSNTTGSFNTATGGNALQFNMEGSANTAHGYQTLNKTTSSFSTAIGYQALANNTTGSSHTALGYRALYSNVGNVGNVAVGSAALEFNNGGALNTAVGAASLKNNSTGSFNAALGQSALLNNTTGSNNSAVGYNSGPAAANPGLTNTTALGNLAIPTASNQARIGNTSVTSIGGQVSWTTFSDGRFKRDLREDVSGLEFINQLRPVSYIVDKNAIDKFLGIPDSVLQLQSQANSLPVRQTGFVAQEVEAIIKKSGYVFSGVEAPQNARDHYSIRYGEFVVPLVKAMQELSAVIAEQERKFEEQRAEITELKKKLGVYQGSNESKSDVQTALFQNNPNPFSINTEIKMTLPETAKQVNLIVYNLEGKQLKDVVVSDRGNAKAIISASELSAGMYLYTLIVDGRIVDTKRLVLTK